jgi:hypothetical protein
MTSYKKYGLVAVAVGVAIAFAAAIPTVVAGSFGSASNGAAPSPRARTAAVVTTGNCTVNRMTYASNSDGGLETSSSTFSTVPGMSRPFDVPFKDTCVEVEISADPFAGVDHTANGSAPLLIVRAVIDSAPCLPSYVYFSGDDDENSNSEWVRVHSYTFICNVTHNPYHPHHIASVQFASWFDGDEVFMDYPTMVVRWGA